MKFSKLQWALILTVTTAVWSSVHPITKILVEELEPLTIAVYRLFFSFLFLIPIAFTDKKHVKFDWREFPKLALIGFTGIVIPMILLPFGLKYSTAANSAVIANTHAIFVYLLAVLLLKEKFSTKKFLWIIAALVGLVIVVTNGSFYFFIGEGNILGNLILTLSSLSLAVTIIIAADFSRKYGGIKTQLLISGVGFPMLLALFFYNWETAAVMINLEQLLLLAFMGIFVAGICWSVFLIALKEMGESNATVFKLLLPVFGTLLSIIFLGEIVSLAFVVGGILILLGIYQTIRVEKGVEIRI